jgi:hypothetical protein
MKGSRESTIIGEEKERKREKEKSGRTITFFSGGGGHDVMQGLKGAEMESE